MKNVIRIGSRDSKLAIMQSEIVMKTMKKVNPKIEFELVTMKTTGDKILDQNLDTIGGKGLFVKELDWALLDEKTDFSVHSLKDLPMEINKDLPIIGFSKREDPRDALILKEGVTLPLEGGIVGTSSKRRMIQLKKYYSNVTFKGIRGNVQTRLRKLEEEDYIGTVLAKAGLIRLGMESCISKVFSIDEMLPAAGQGTLVIQGRKGEDYGYLKEFLDPISAIVSKAERSFVTALEGGCSSPVAAYAEVKGNQVQLKGLYYHEAADDFCVGEIFGEVENAEQLGETLAFQLKKQW